jgi:ankyrin repeat protein
MQNTPLIMEIVNSNNVTTEDALKIIDALSAEDIIQQDNTGATILHHLCFGREVQPFKFDFAQVVGKVVAKNPAILTSKWQDLKTPIDIAIIDNDLEAVKILAPYYAKAKLEIIVRERIKKIAPRNDLGVNEIMSGEEVIEEAVTETSPLSPCLRHGLFEMFQYFIDNGFGPLQGLENLSKYNLSDPTKENLQEFYKDLLVVGNKEILKALHKHLGYYEGHAGKNSKELISAIRARNEEEALKLILQGHYIYDFSGFHMYNMSDEKILDFLFLNNLHHPNYNFLAKDLSGNTPWQFAVFRGRGKSVLALIEVAKGNGIDLKTLFAPDGNGNTPMHLAVIYGHKEIAVGIIEAAKGNPELLKTLFARNKHGDTPLHLAVLYDYKEIAVMLLKAAKGNPKLLKTLFAPNEIDDTPLNWLSRNDKKEIVVLFLERAKGNPELLKALFARNEYGDTLLHFLIRNDKKEIVVLLLEGAKGNPEILNTLFAPNDGGNTPLHLAVFYGRKEIVELLLANGACPPLMMLLNNTFSTEMNTMLRSGFVRNYPYNAYSAVWNILEGAAKAYACDISEVYKQKPQQPNRNRDNQNQR